MSMCTLDALLINNNILRVDWIGFNWKWFPLVCISTNSTNSCRSTYMRNTREANESIFEFRMLLNIAPAEMNISICLLTNVYVHQIGYFLQSLIFSSVVTKMKPNQSSAMESVSLLIGIKGFPQFISNFHKWVMQLIPVWVWTEFMLALANQF